MSLESLVPIISYSIWIIFIIYLIVRKIIFSKVNKISENIKELKKINESYEFSKAKNNIRRIIYDAYSYSDYRRITASEIVRYNIENNKRNIRDYIENSISNKEKYDKYLEEVNVLKQRVTGENLSLKRKIFNNVEAKLIKKNMIKKDVYDISFHVIACYESLGKRNPHSKNKLLDYYQIIKIYDLWKKGKKYEISTKMERAIMSDSIRYDVLKRDNFRCRLCGMSASDGAKLHVDHIVPVSKGGKTTISNLQTLCERCNLGKSNK